MMNLETEHFKLEEIRCPCGNCEPVIDQKHLVKMQTLRYEFGRPIIVNSWHRCRAYNRKLKGSALDSEHIRGNAADVRLWHYTKSEQFELLLLAFKFGFQGIGIYSGYLHLDSRSTPTYWTKA